MQAGLGNIREHMEQYKEVHHQMEKATIEFKRKHASISQKLELNQRPNLGLAKYRKELESLTARLAVLEEAEERFQEVAAAFEEQTLAEVRTWDLLGVSLRDFATSVFAFKSQNRHSND
jgi:hypothetical protein